MMFQGAPNQPQKLGLGRGIIAFSRMLRRHGLGTTIRQVHHALAGLAFIDPLVEEEFRSLLRATLVSRYEEVAEFEQTYEVFWRTDISGFVFPERTDEQSRQPGPDDIPAAETAPFFQPEPAGIYQPIAAGWEDNLVRKDFRRIDPVEAPEMAKIITQLARKMAQRVCRRWRISHKTGRLDMRRTFRVMVRTGGFPVNLRYREKKVQKHRLTVFCDVSGSMKIYTRFLLLFIHSLQSHIKNTETFIFSTSLTRITPLLRGTTFAQAMQKISRQEFNWSGGTNIGASLAAFNRGDLQALVDRKTTVVIISDGWDRGERELLDDELKLLHHRAGRIFWLNPLMGCPEYAPECGGLQTALPYLTRLAPFYNLQTLKEFGQLLEHSFYYPDCRLTSIVAPRPAWASGTRPGE